MIASRQVSASGLVRRGRCAGRRRGWRRRGRPARPTTPRTTVRPVRSRAASRRSSAAVGDPQLVRGAGASPSPSRRSGSGSGVARQRVAREVVDDVRVPRDERSPSASLVPSTTSSRCRRSSSRSSASSSFDCAPRLAAMATSEWQRGVRVGHAGDVVDQLVGDARQSARGRAAARVAVAESPPSQRQFERRSETTE